MIGFCLGMGLNLIQATLPTDILELSWQHSVEKVRWSEQYQIQNGQLKLTEARIQGTGAGMEPPPDAVFDGSAWRYTPANMLRDFITLTRSTYTEDYRLCWNGACQSLTTLLGPIQQEGETVKLFPCREVASSKGDLRLR